MDRGTSPNNASERVIEESSSLYAFNVVVIGKKDGAGEGMDRLCINYALLTNVLYQIGTPYQTSMKCYQVSGVEIVYSN